MALISLFNQNEEQKDPVVLSLTVPGLWKAIAGVWALLAAAFTGGMYYQSDVAKLQVDQKNFELNQSKADFDRLQKSCPVSKTKETFDALESRLSLKKKEAARYPSNKKLQKEVIVSAWHLAGFLDKNVNQKPDESGTPIISVVLDNKDPKDSRIQFRGEAETHPIPQEVQKLTKNVTWINTPQENGSPILKAVLAQQRDDSSDCQLCPSKKKSPLPTRQAGVLDIRRFYPVMVHPQP